MTKAVLPRLLACIRYVGADEVWSSHRLHVFMRKRRALYGFVWLALLVASGCNLNTYSFGLEVDDGGRGRDSNGNGGEDASGVDDGGTPIDAVGSHPDACIGINE